MNPWHIVPMTLPRLQEKHLRCWPQDKSTPVAFKDLKMFLQQSRAQGFTLTHWEVRMWNLSSTSSGRDTFMQMPHTNRIFSLVVNCSTPQCWRIYRMLLARLAAFCTETASKLQCGRATFLALAMERRNSNEGLLLQGELGVPSIPWATIC